MLQALFGEIKGIFGRSFLLTGVLPAALLLLGQTWFSEGMKGLQGLAHELLSEGETFAAQGALFAGVLLTCSLGFFASRRIILEAFQNMPWRWLYCLRLFLTKRQMIARRQTVGMRERLKWDLTPIKWYEHKFERPTFVPEWLKIERRDKTSFKSKTARAYVEAAMLQLPERPLTARAYRKISAGLRELHAVSYSVSGLFDDEIAQWQLLLADSRAKNVLRLVEEEANRRWIRARDAARAWPSDERWLEPTAFGNRIASLDDYAERRYKIETSTLWSRLWYILPKQARKEVSDAKLNVEVQLNLSVAFSILLCLVVVPFILQIVVGIRGIGGWEYCRSLLRGEERNCLRSLAFVGASLLLTRLTYLAAVQAMSTLADSVINLVDLYRLRLLVACGYKAPATVKEELEFFSELRGFFDNGDQRLGTRELSPPQMSEDSESAEGQNK